MKKAKILPIVTIVLFILCIAGFVTYGISRSMLLDTKAKVNDLKLNVKLVEATADEAEPTTAVVVETVNPKSNLENKLNELNNEILQYTKHKADMIEVAEKFVEARYTYEGKQYEEVENIINAVSPYACQDYCERLVPELERNSQGNMINKEFPSGYKTEVIRTFEEIQDEDNYSYMLHAPLYVEAHQTVERPDKLDDVKIYNVEMTVIDGNWYVYNCVENDTIMRIGDQE